MKSGSRSIAVRGRAVLWLIASALLVACGGAEDPVVSVSEPTSDVPAEAMAGDVFTASLSASLSATNLGTQTVYVQARDSGTLFAPASAAYQAPDARIRLDLQVLPAVPAGEYKGTIELRACPDAACNSVFADATTQVAYEVRLLPAPDWQTHQGDGAHRGYVGMLLDPARFTKAWEWHREPSDEPVGGINAVVTAHGKVYVTNDVYFGEGVLRALDETTGAEVWKHSFGQVPALNPPALGGGRVYAAITGHELTALWAFDAESGEFVHKSPFAAQWPYFLAPVVHRDAVYMGGGVVNNEINSFSVATGSRNWTSTNRSDDDLFTPAVDDAFVYHYDGWALLKMDRATGAILARIEDGLGPRDDGYAYFGSPMIGSSNNVIAFSGNTYSYHAGASREQEAQRVLTSFLVESSAVGWNSAHSYLAVPALANGVVYAARNEPMSLDAIDETTGRVLWSWAPEAGSGDNSFHRNIVVTRNLLFVSTDKRVVAIDIHTRAPVWNHPAPGMLALSAGRTLYIATGATASDGGLVAIRLK